MENNILSGNLSVGLVKIICLPDQMSGKNLNTFTNTVVMGIFIGCDVETLGH